MNIISSLLGNLNYGTILLLMLLESTVIPVPSELVVAPAAYHAARGRRHDAAVHAPADCGIVPGGF
jgi:membrane protein YqaA with SNARE-associated domain